MCYNQTGDISMTLRTDLTYIYIYYIYIYIYIYVYIYIIFSI